MDIQTVVQKLVRQLEREIATHPGERALLLRVHVGESSGIEPQLLMREFSNAVRDTPLQATTLLIETDVRDAVCDQCGNRFRFGKDKFECDKCGSLKLSLHGGK